MNRYSSLRSSREYFIKSKIMSSAILDVLYGTIISDAIPGE